MTPSLPVPVDVDERTGAWSVDGIPMILAPRHMIVNNLRATEDAVGHDRSAEMLHDAGYRSAQTWCRQQCEYHSLDETAVVHHYLDQLGRRGWGRFAIRSLDLERGEAEIVVTHSSLADADGAAQRPTCYLFRSWLEGALDLALAGAGRPTGFHVEEAACAGTGASSCTFLGHVTTGADHG